MALIPQTFPTPTEAAVASYSYTDIAEGTGIQILYGCNSNAGGSDDYHLIKSVVASNDIVLHVVEGNTFDLDFDLSHPTRSSIGGVG